jgi:hypothetical protein
VRAATGVALTAAVAGLLSALLATEHTVMVYSALLLPGTAAHEALHWVAAAWLGADPQGFTLWPVRDADGVWTLGSVQARVGLISTASVALAPLALAPVAVRLTVSASRGGPVRRALCAYLAACAWLSFWPSGVDWALATSAPTSWLLAGVLALVVMTVTWAALPGRESTYAARDDR